jgi:hypothetical protein
VADPAYTTMLKDLFPGHNDDYYNMLKMCGTIGSPVFENLPQADKVALMNFFYNNGIYY